MIMNRKMIVLFFISGVLFFSRYAAAVQEITDTGKAANLSASEKAVVDSLVDQYFDSLFSGDMIGLKNISTGKLFTQIERLNTNPGYSDFLRKQYMNATYKLVDYRLNSSKKLMVAVNVTKKDGAENRFLIYIDRNSGNTESGQQMKIEDAEKQ